jgi:predicted ATPase with chaperone activity
MSLWNVLRSALPLATDNLDRALRTHGHGFRNASLQRAVDESSPMRSYEHEVGIRESPAHNWLVATRDPFRALHHTISDVGPIGGGQVPLPGEGLRAHHGMLFLSELPEF